MKRHSMAGIFTLLSFAAMAATMLLVLLLGLRCYRALVQRDEESYTSRICVQYIRSKVQHADQNGGVFVAPFTPGDDTSPAAVYLLDPAQGDVCTRIYYYDGSVRELCAPAAESFSPEDGGEILPAGGLSLLQTGSLLDVTVTASSGRQSRIVMALRSGEGAA